MAVQVQVAGLASVKLDGDLIGYTRNGVDVTKEAFWIDVPGDENGGDDGPPVDIQYLGEIARVRLELTKWDEAMADKIRARLKGETAGTIPTPGTLMAAGSKTYTLTIDCVDTTLVRHFYHAIPRMPIEMNRGTKFSTLVCEFECHKDGTTGLLYTDTAS